MLKIERAASADAKVFVSDRSHLSIVGYQLPRVSLQYGEAHAALTRKLLLEVRSTIESVVSNIKIVDVLLVMDEFALQRRVLGRGEPALSSIQVEFLMAAQEEMKRLQPAYVIDVTSLSLDETLRRIREIVADELTP